MEIDKKKVRDVGEGRRREIIRTRAKIVTTGMGKRGCVFGVLKTRFQLCFLFKTR